MTRDGLSRPLILGPQARRRIDATRAPRRQERSERADEHQQYRRADERERIPRPDAIKQRPKHLSAAEAEQQIRSPMPPTRGRCLRA